MSRIPQYAQFRGETRVRRRPPAEEEAFMNEIIRVATTLGYNVYHTHDSRRSQPGWPDLVLAKPQRLLFVECKSRKGKVASDQQVWLELLGSFRGVWQRVGTFAEQMEIGVYLWHAPGDWKAIVSALGYG